MCNLSSVIERRGIAIGRAEGRIESKKEGRAEGKFEATAMYYKKGRISLEEAASDLNMPPTLFIEKIKERNLP